MSDEQDKKLKLNRRDFVASGVGGLAGAALFGVVSEEKQTRSAVDRTPSALPRKDPRDLANDPKQMKGHYPFIIVGSGYGGSVLAARLSASGKQVCILERGREWHPGMFPTGGSDIATTGRTKLNPLGLLDSNLHIKSDVDVICASGLGGTSLINAAIASRPEALVWQQREWPRELKEDFANGKIDKYMNRAQGILKSTKHPRAMDLKKTRLHQRMTEENGLPFNQLTLNVNHRSNGEKNVYGIPQSACTLCGDCCAGCNVGAKNVLTVNYIPIAKANGAEIYSMIEVNHIEKKNGKYIVHYTKHMAAFGLLPRKGQVSTDCVIMAAGSMGSTEIMMKSRLKGLRLSPALGSRFSANGDVMGMSYNGNGSTDILGTKGLLKIEAPVGQAIMVYADYRKPYRHPSEVDLMERYLLLDGTLPSVLSPMLAKAFAAYALANPRKFTAEQIQKAKIDLYDTAQPEDNGALNNSMVFFACGHDSFSGKYVLDHALDRVHVSWKNVVNEKSFQFINREMAKFAKVHGGTFIPNPRSTIFGKKMQATHPLGGCPMADDGQWGVVDHIGRVFDDNGTIHRGFYIVDASIIPRSLGATPLLTISALAERIADYIIADPSIGT
ncbi:MAG TPA: GMC family oxidoreductase [Bacteriovoracaceae bacterium]|nr:GMC family oxidoreductase [Bacteriovoracaceae bacterium]